MYGEDIDLSYRIKLAGFRNVYFPLTTIIHYKGESTKKGSINYVIVFYNAMIIFAQKHFARNTARYYSLFIHIAIYFRAGCPFCSGFSRELSIPCWMRLLIYAGYRNYCRFGKCICSDRQESIRHVYMNVVVPAYILIWIFPCSLPPGMKNR